MRYVIGMTAAMALSGAAVARPADRGAPDPGTVSVEMVTTDAPEGVRQIFAEAVAHALEAAGFLALPTAGHSRYRARVTIGAVERGMARAKVGSTTDASAGDWGAHLRIGLPSDKTRSAALVVTNLHVELVDRDAGPVWEGTATTAQIAGTRAGSPELVAQKLADALIERFPARSDRPISVP